MPSAPDGPLSTLPASASGRRMFSRISPFSNSPRTIAEFTVTVNDEHKQYSPGDAVRGSVTVRTTKPTRITHIAVSLHGFVRVYKNPGTPVEGHRQNSARLHKSGDAFGNGFAVLLEEEQVLCGDGKLTEGTFRFEFDLDFPETHDLPSSIDFERGTITYMVTATLTRPTTISPTLTSERKIYFVERIDISRLGAPKARTITLEALRKRSKAQSQARRLADPNERNSSTIESSRYSSDPSPLSRPPSVPSTNNENGLPESPSRSDISFDSAASHVLVSPSESQYPQSLLGSESGTVSTSKLSLSSKIITATVEPEVSGCLRGDFIPVKVNVTHTKHIKSLYGIIVTFYRVARVDMNPSVPIGPTEKGKGLRHEDYYPRSMTGLSGLSLSGAGSNHTFRKDLSQATLPLIVDPVTLTAEVNAKVRVPDDAFPTINKVPGSMISFRYYVEVILDIQGKNANLGRGLASPSTLLPDHVVLAETSNMERSASTPFGSTVIDTSSIRRDKSVITCDFEVTVGTRDSERRKDKRRADPGLAPDAQQTPTAKAPAQTQPQSQNHLHPRDNNRDRSIPAGVNAYDGSRRDADYGWEGNHYYDPQYYDPQYYDPRWDQYGYAYGQYENADAGTAYDGYYPNPDPSYEAHDYFHAPPPPPVPLPSMPDEYQMTDKERARLHELRLLPSQPPTDENAANGVNGAHEATAPHLPDEIGDGMLVPSASSDPTSSLNAVASSSSQAAVRTSLQARTATLPQSSASASAFTPAPPPAPSPQPHPSRTDNNIEPQRQDLYAQASAPTIDQANSDTNAGEVNDQVTSNSVLVPATSSIHDHEPTAPTADDIDPPNDVHDSHADASPAAPGLPRYER